MQRINAERTHLHEVAKKAKLISGHRVHDSEVPFGGDPKRGLLGCPRLLDPDWAAIT